MKKILAFLLMLFSLHMFAGTVNMEVQEKEVVHVELKEKSSEEDDKNPRTLIPITCIYADGIVQVTFLENLGEMEFFVTNQATGEQWSTVNNWVLKTSTASGVYLVEIIIGDGTLYYGTYTL